MGLMTSLRNRAGLVIFVIGLAIVAFLLGDAINVGTPFWQRSQNEVGSINGEGIDYQSFNGQVDQASQMYQQQMGGAASPQMRGFAVQQVWNQFLTQNLLNQEIDKIGLQVGKEELNSLLFGNNPSPQIIQAFTNPQTGQFDKNYLSAVIEQAKTNPEMNAQWEGLLENVRNERLNQKYTNLINNSIYTTSLEAEYDYNSRNKLANFKYVMLDYASVKDSEIKLTDADYKEYYDKNKNAFKNPEEIRTLEYVLFDAKPNSADSALVLGEIQKLKTELQASTNDSSFVTINSENKYPVRYYTKGQLSPALDSVAFKTAAGTVVGPFLTQNVYEIAKVIAVKNSPDSVNASHILINPATEGGVDKAMAKADSIKNLIQGGANFAALAVEFSADPNSKNNAGEIGTLTRGAFPELDETLFEGKAGDVKVVSTNYGVHIVKINRQIGNSQIAKLAIVDKSINSGKETTDAAYSKANQFFTAANKDNFNDIAKQQNVEILKNDRTVAMDNMLGGVEVPRELIRWAFEAKNGETSDKVYETTDNFIVARVTNIQPKGIQPLESVKTLIEPVVKNLVKARMLKEKMNNALSGAGNIDQVAQKLGKNVQTVDNVVLANPVIPGVAVENAVVGTVFGLQPNKPSKSIEGKQGVYAVQVAGFVNPKALAGEELTTQQKQITEAKSQRAWGTILKALQDNAKIVDNRIKFY
ncbi:peptidylprolyl isomerase [Sphingobacterium mizutaii NBRC 14946 = DSM 11724]|uniref:Periplasmic chaperone PpiD n=2 Tax=Sphingobacterium mizutaii TaxID=1010 RepID=A0AAJ4X8I0_9SPHI|nr:SurA N-terminal domain-containing protein [Sphingobacterium mizutaii]GEM69455.1 peptidylprolyl isomerase [Sphingobacterium mizutaii NBRC 14946 = DSM 11724]SDL72459.1 peptidyl-prolyl cis-trans isomerase D [Sphingobacterium mizutaii]SNV41245.1 Peptidyl-prolyl cis-trans isomerase surA [Sphingobacterium mizutaii]